MGAGRTREFSVFSVNLKPLKKNSLLKSHGLPWWLSGKDSA